MAKAGSKIEVGTVYRIDGSVEVKSPHWFKARVVTGDILLCTGKSAPGVSYLLLDLDQRDDTVSAVGIDLESEARLVILATPGGVTQVWTPTKRERYSLLRGDALKGEPVTILTAAQVQGRAANGHRGSYQAPASVEG